MPTQPNAGCRDHSRALGTRRPRVFQSRCAGSSPTGPMASPGHAARPMVTSGHVGAALPTSAPCRSGSSCTRRHRGCTAECAALSPSRLRGPCPRRSSSRRSCLSEAHNPRRAGRGSRHQRAPGSPARLLPPGTLRLLLALARAHHPSPTRTRPPPWPPQASTCGSMGWWA